MKYYLKQNEVETGPHSVDAINRLHRAGTIEPMTPCRLAGDETEWKSLSEHFPHIHPDICISCRRPFAPASPRNRAYMRCDSCLAAGESQRQGEKQKDSQSDSIAQMLGGLLIARGGIALFNVAHGTTGLEGDLWIIPCIFGVLCIVCAIAVNNPELRKPAAIGALALGIPHLLGQIALVLTALFGGSSVAAFGFAFIMVLDVANIGGAIYLIRLLRKNSQLLSTTSIHAAATQHAKQNSTAP